MTMPIETQEGTGVSARPRRYAGVLGVGTSGVAEGLGLQTTMRAGAVRDAGGESLSRRRLVNVVGVAGNRGYSREPGASDIEGCRCRPLVLPSLDGAITRRCEPFPARYHALDGGR